MKRLVAAAPGCTAVLCAVQICYGVSCPPNTFTFSNVLVNSGTRPTVTGSVGGVGVTFDSTLDAVLSGDANGQADVSSVDGLLNDLTFTIQNGYMFEAALFNLFPIAGNIPTIGVVRATARPV